MYYICTTSDISLTPNADRFTPNTQLFSSIFKTKCFMKNLGNLHISTSDMQLIDGHLTDLEQLFDRYLKVLSADERLRYSSVNEKNKLIINKVYDILRDYPQHIPADIDRAEFERDYNTRQYLERKIARLQALAKNLDDVKILHDYDNLQDSLGVYDFLQYLEKRQIPGIAELVAEMRQFFARPRNTATPTEPTTPDE